MRIYYSGSSSIKGLPELLIREMNPCIMLSYFEIHKGDGVSTARLAKHTSNLSQKKKTSNANRKS